MSYGVYVTRVKNIRPAKNADRLNLCDVFGNTVVVGKDVNEKDLYIYFPTDGQISGEFGKTHDLFRRKDEDGKPCGCLQKDRASEASYISLIGNRYGKLVVLERVENNRFGHVCYRCKCDCGGETIVDAGNLRTGNTNSCGCIKSKGEMIINNWLQEHNIDFRSQYSFDNCVLSTGRRPFFDFVLFKNDKPYLVIEYNGRQHYEATGGWNTEKALAKTQRRDREKLQWCEDNHYPVLIIKYDEDIFRALEGLIKEEALEPDLEEREEYA